MGTNDAEIEIQRCCRLLQLGGDVDRSFAYERLPHVLSNDRSEVSKKAFEDVFRVVNKNLPKDVGDDGAHDAATSFMDSLVEGTLRGSLSGVRTQAWGCLLCTRIMSTCNESSLKVKASLWLQCLLSSLYSLCISSVENQSILFEFDGYGQDGCDLLMAIVKTENLSTPSMQMVCDLFGVVSLSLEKLQSVLEGLVEIRDSKGTVAL